VTATVGSKLRHPPRLRTSSSARVRPAASSLACSREDPLAFADFYRAFFPKVLDFFAHRTWNRQVAFDLAAETFAKAFEKRADFRGGSEEQAAGWLWAIARNELHAHWRARSAQLIAIERLTRSSFSSFDQDIARLEERLAVEPAREALRSGVGALSPQHREAIAMRVLEDLDYDELAQRLQVSNQVARTRVSRGLRSLRQTPGLRESIVSR
jgi:RNA polymerase sigma factor (sigma-70 family)